MLLYWCRYFYVSVAPKYHRVEWSKLANLNWEHKRKRLAGFAVIIAAVGMSPVLWEIALCSKLKDDSRFWLRWLLAWLVLRLRRPDPTKRRLILNGLHVFVSQKMGFLGAVFLNIRCKSHCMRNEGLPWLWSQINNRECLNFNIHLNIKTFTHIP
jgi:hypothetical protein